MNEPERIDLFVIGGGINGAGIARDAAGRGLKVVLCEKDDLAEGTSSRSGKLVHGGLRYLEYYEFRLVREALIEREVLLNAAPHIIWPMRFVLPHSPQDRPAWLVRLGLFLYDHLGGRKKLPGTRTLDLARDPEGTPILDQYTRGFEYSDCWVDDARLVTLNAIGAAEKGAVVLTRSPAVSARRENGAWTVTTKNSLTGENRSFRAKCLINCAGPWVSDVINRVAGSNSTRNVRLVKGSHIIVPKFWAGSNAYLVQNHDKRVIFINPYEGDKALIGTTDIAYEGRAEDVSADEGEIDYLLKAVNRYFKEKLRRQDVLHSSPACVRSSTTAKATRLPSRVTTSSTSTKPAVRRCSMSSAARSPPSASLPNAACSGSSMFSRTWEATGPKRRLFPAATCRTPTTKPSPTACATPIPGCRASWCTTTAASMARARKPSSPARAASTVSAGISAGNFMRQRRAISSPANGRRRRRTSSTAARNTTCT